MISPDKRLENLKHIIERFKVFCEKKGKVTEADTRALLIDEILEKVLGWDDLYINREKYSKERGYMDYELTAMGKKRIVVEAKKEGVPFLFPQSNEYQTLKLNGTLISDAEIKEAIYQVRSYCDNEGIRYAVATNGYSWIIFRAIREDMSWKEGNARIFKSLENIVENFTSFYNLLSYEAVSSGMLDSEFGIELRRKRNLFRVTDRLVNADAPLIRNNLHTQLSPIIQYFFEDIVHEENLTTIEKCYVYRTTQLMAADDLDSVIKNSIPKFLPNSTEKIIETKKNAGRFETAIRRAKKEDNGQLFLLLGGIGSGKTTFQKRYQLTVGKETLEDGCVWFSIDFLKAPLTPEKLEHFVWTTISEQMRLMYSHLNLESRENIEKAFQYEINNLKQTSLHKLKPGSEAYDKKLSEQLGLWQKNLEKYIPRLLKSPIVQDKFSIIIFVDNVDQLKPEYQADIFKLSQRITRIIGSVTIVALREESYYTASVRKIFTAYINRQFHIASPPFRIMVGLRINYCLQLIEGTGPLPMEISQINSTERKKICDLLRIVEFSIFEQNKNIARFIDALCFGNMRMGLQMFSLFLTSGVTDVDKMLRIYDRDGLYFVAFHEFLKAIMLDDRYYYKDSRSKIMNLFDCGVERNSSHFTSIRILELLNTHKSEYTAEGQGFIEINTASVLFENVFNNKEDFLKSLGRLVSRQLVETNNKAIEDIKESTSIRVTASGQYYLNYLLRSFSYLDLIVQDMPFNDEKVAQEMTDSVKAVGNKWDREDEKDTRMEERFNRVEKLMNYLEIEEKEEIQLYQLNQLKDSPITKPIVNKIIENYHKEREIIKDRLQRSSWNYVYSKLPDFQNLTTFLPENDEDTNVEPI